MAYKFKAYGYKLSGDVRSGLHATVTYLMPWSEAFLFIDQILPAPTAIGNAVHWRPPAAINLLIGSSVRPLYAQSFTADPVGSTGVPATQGGLAPGDFYSHVFFTVEFESPTYPNTPEDDPNNKNQLDPENPVEICEQTVEIVGKITTRKGSGFKYSGSGKPVLGDLPMFTPEGKLVLTFPRIPLLPWQLIQPFIGKTNDQPLFGCVQGSLLLEGMGTKVVPSTDGSIAQQLQLKFAFNPDPTNGSVKGLDWNSFPLPDGSGYDILVAADGSGKKMYLYVHFQDLFTALSLL